MADIDDDGDQDLLVGDSNGYITVYFRNDEGALEREGRLRIEGEILNLGDRAAPHTVDWDLDADFDLLIGSAAGTIRLFINEGTAEEYDFSDAGAVNAEGEEIWLGSETAPAMADVDGDDARDLIVGCIYGEIWFYPNVGEDEAPEFGEGMQLDDANGHIAVGNYSRPEVVDWDADGDVDIITGLRNPEILFYGNPAEEGVADGRFTPPPFFLLLSNYPEPFNGRTTLLFHNHKPQSVSLMIADVNGRGISNLDLGLLAAGEQLITLDLSGLAAGRYPVVIQMEREVVTAVITLVK